MCDKQELMQTFVDKYIALLKLAKKKVVAPEVVMQKYSFLKTETQLYTAIDSANYYTRSIRDRIKLKEEAIRTDSKDALKYCHYVAELTALFEPEFYEYVKYMSDRYY